MSFTNPMDESFEGAFIAGPPPQEACEPVRAGELAEKIHYYEWTTSGGWDGGEVSVQKTKDGRYVYWYSWYETTFDGNGQYVSDNLEDIYRWCCTEEERKEWGITLDERDSSS